MEIDRTMKFCPDCESILLPRKKKNELYCKVCDKIFKMDKEKSKTESEYRIQRKMTRDLIPKTAVIHKKEKKHSITEEDRRGFEFSQST
ncbi:MAG: hypothetical protein ACTSWY_16020 [Promethearchaeota archaeon]